MELMLFNQPEFERLYNCSAYRVDAVPLERRLNIPISLMFLVIGVFEELLYVPCMIAIWRFQRHNHCYKMMFLMCALDMLCLLVNAIATGWLGLCGAVYCSHPRAIYVLGAAGLSLWMSESSLELLLAINRCAELACPAHVVERLFGGGRVWLWMFASVAYGLYVFVWEKPILFSALFQSWFFNPHVGYTLDESPDALGGETYVSVLHSTHNVVLICALTATYLTFALVLLHQICNGRRQHTTTTTNGLNPQQQQTNNIHQQHKMIFVQVVLISALNAVAASVYVYMQYLPTPKVLILLGQFCWIQAHG